MQIPDHISSSYIQNCFKSTSLSKSKSSKKLASGYRINTAADDAAKLSISEKMRAQIRGLDQASNNIQDSISFLQVADGALETASAITQRIRELAVQAANDTYTDQDRDQMQQECDQLQKELYTIFARTTFHTKQVFSKTINPDELSSEDIKNLLRNGHIPLFDTAQAVDGSEVSADTLNLISRSLRIMMLADDFSEKATKGELSMDTPQGQIFVANYLLEFIQYAKKIEGFGQKEEYQKMLDTATSHINTAIKDAASGQSGSGFLWYARGQLVDIYYKNKSGAIENFCRSISELISFPTNNSKIYMIYCYNFLKENEYITPSFRNALSGALGNIYDRCSIYKKLQQAFNTTQKLLSFQIGANANNMLEFQLDIPLFLLTSPAFTLISRNSAEKSIEQADQYLINITTLRAKIGAYQNRLESALSYTGQGAEALQDTESRMRDANMAKEAADYAKTKLQNDFQVSFLAQKNASHNDLSVLSFPKEIMFLL